MGIEDPELFRQVVIDQFSTNYMSVAALAVVVYDHVITLRDEVEHIWNSKWSLMKIVYLWNRYFGLYNQAFNASIRRRWMKTDEICNTYLQILGVNATIVISTVDFVLMYRVWILYERSKILLYCMFPLLIAEAFTMTFVEAFTVMRLPREPQSETRKLG